METVTVNAQALRTVLEALNGPSHLIRELQVIRNLSGHECPINRLINEYNNALKEYNTDVNMDIHTKNDNSG